jgi:hypothetical protein
MAPIITVTQLNPAFNPTEPILCIVATKPPMGTYPAWKAIQNAAIEPVAIPPTVNPNKKGTTPTTTGNKENIKVKET